jgi:queuine tRNA-ribosyltransferase
VSFSRDVSALRLALSHKKRFPYLRHGAADTLIHRGVWESRYRTGLSWTLVREGVASAPEAFPPDLIVSLSLPESEDLKAAQDFISTHHGRHAEVISCAAELEKD